LLPLFFETGSCHVAPQTGLELMIFLDSISHVLGLHVCTTTPSS
jgi:hypothetical protein